MFHDASTSSCCVKFKFKLFWPFDAPRVLTRSHAHLAAGAGAAGAAQRFYIRVIWMVPIYAVQSWLALR